MATLDIIIKQMILSAFRSAKMTSASPGHVNRFIGIESQGGMDILGSNEEINNAIREAVKEVVSDPDSADDLTEELLDSKEKTGKNKIGTPLTATKKGLGIVENPASIVSMGLQLLPHAALVAFVLSITPLILDTMLKPGGLFDRRLKIVMSEVVNGLALDRQTQKNYSIGIRQLTIQSRAGFRNIQGIGSEDSLRQIREGTGTGLRKSTLDFTDFSKGVREIRE